MGLFCGLPMFFVDYADREARLEPVHGFPTAMLRRLCRIRWLVPDSLPAQCRLLQQFRCLSSASVVAAANTRLPPRIKIDENEIQENFIKGGGSGGQKINKTNSQVQLIHHPTGITIKCQETRSRSQNRTIARRILAERLEDLQMGDQSRSALKQQKLIRKKANAKKKTKRKYKKLDDEKGTASVEADDDDVMDGDDAVEEDAAVDGPGQAFSEESITENGPLQGPDK